MRLLSPDLTEGKQGKENFKMKKLLLKVKKYIEDATVTQDSEWGHCRDIEQIIEDKYMPSLYYEILDEINKLQ
jgi:hypothetical protein